MRKIDIYKDQFVNKKSKSSDHVISNDIPDLLPTDELNAVQIKQNLKSNIYHQLQEDLKGYLEYTNRVNNALCLVNSKGSILLYNDFFQTLTGKQFSDLLNQSIHTMLKDMKLNLSVTLQDKLALLPNNQRTIIYSGPLSTDPYNQVYDLWIEKVNPGLTGMEMLLFILSPSNDKINSAFRNSVNTQEEIDDLKMFNYLVAHEVQSPLRIIDSYSNILLSEHGEELNDEVIRILKIIQKKSGGGRSLVENLLMIANLENRKIEYRTVDINLLLKEVIQDLDDFRDDVKLIINTDFPKVKVVPVLFNHLLTNILGNAYKFTMKNPSAEIRMDWEESDHEFTFWVEDNGIGIQPEFIDKVFKPFFRINDNDSFKGNGLGLAMAKKIIDLHSGKIWVESEFNVFSKFIFSIPKNTKD